MAFRAYHKVQSERPRNLKIFTFYANSKRVRHENFSRTFHALEEKKRFTLGSFIRLYTMMLMMIESSDGSNVKCKAKNLWVKSFMNVCVCVCGVT